MSAGNPQGEAMEDVLEFVLAPESVRAVMLPVLEEFRAWVREGVNRHGVKVRVPSGGSGMTFHGPGFEVSI